MLPACMKLVTEARQSIKEISWEELAEKTDPQGFLIDLREPDEFNNGSIPGAFNLPRGLLEFKIQSCPGLEHLCADELLSAHLYLFCSIGGRSVLAAQSLEKLGFNHVFSIRGGLALRP